MQLNGEVLVGAPRERVWAALNDAEVLGRCIPGCEAMADSAEHEKTATVAVKVGPVRARFSGHVRMDDIRDGESCTLHFEGQGGAAGMARGSSRVELLDAADGSPGTQLRYQTQASVAGKLGQVGGRMIDAAARQMADQFFAALQTELAPAAAQSTIAPEAAEPVLGEAQLASKPAIVSAPQPQPAPDKSVQPQVAAASAQANRVLWFALGAVSTGLGVWLGRALFS